MITDDCFCQRLTGGGLDHTITEQYCPKGLEIEERCALDCTGKLSNLESTSANVEATVSKGLRMFFICVKFTMCELHLNVLLSASEHSLKGFPEKSTPRTGTSFVGTHGFGELESTVILVQGQQQYWQNIPTLPSGRLP